MGSEAGEDPSDSMAASAVADVELLASACSTATILEGRAAGGVAKAGERGVARLTCFTLADARVGVVGGVCPAM